MTRDGHGCDDDATKARGLIVLYALSASLELGEELYSSWGVVA